MAKGYWSPTKQCKAVTLRGEGYSEIAKKLGNGATKSGVRKVCESFKATNTFKNMPKNGKIKKTIANDDRMIMRLALKNRRATSAEIKNDLGAARVSVSSRTIRRRLFENGLKARRPRKKPYLNKKQRKNREILSLKKIFEQKNKGVDKRRLGKIYLE